MTDNGWEASTGAWIKKIDEGAPERALLLDDVVLGLCGDVTGKRVLDAGCGEGRFSRMLAERGASVMGLDATSGMVSAFRERRPGAEEVVLASAEALPLHDALFDLVVSYLVLIDVPDFRAAIREMHRALRPGGMAVVANVSFMSVSNTWIRDEAGKRLHYPMDNYLEERSIRLEWAGISITNYHRPLSAYMETFLGAGFVLTDFIEPMPKDESLRDDPYFEDWFRLPNFVVMRWRKP